MAHRSRNTLFQQTFHHGSACLFPKLGSPFESSRRPGTHKPLRAPYPTKTSELAYVTRKTKVDCSGLCSLEGWFPTHTYTHTQTGPGASWDQISRAMVKTRRWTIVSRGLRTQGKYFFSRCASLLRPSHTAERLVRRTF